MHSRSVIQAFNALHWSPQGQVRCTRLCGVQEHVAWTRNSKHYAGSRDNGLITGQRQHLRRHSSVRASVHTRRPLKNGFLHLGQDKGKTSYCSVTQQLRFRQGSITRAISHSSKFCMAASNYGEIVEIKPKAEHTATIIFLHGLGLTGCLVVCCQGDSGRGISSVNQGLNLPHVKFLFPTAPEQPITCFGGAPARGWFDLYGIDRMMKGDKDEAGIKASVDYLSSLVQKEVSSGIPASRIVLGGFSQGGHIAAKQMLQSRHSVPACLMLSTWLESVSTQPSEAGKSAIYWIGHGTNDSMLPLQMSAVSEGVLQSKGCKDVRRKTYSGMEHSVSPEELKDLQIFLDDILPQNTGPSPTLESLQSMSVRQLREYLKSKNISTTGFLEKSEFLDAAKQTL